MGVLLFGACNTKHTKNDNIQDGTPYHILNGPLADLGS